MRLTNYHRQAIIKAVMNDVPEVDYIEQIRSLVYKLGYEMLDKLGLAGADSTRLCECYVRVRGNHYKINGLNQSEVTTIQQNSEVTALSLLNQQQFDARQSLERKLTTALAACYTSKQAIDAFPEFEKYIPNDAVQSNRSLPVIANVFADFVKAGWPKDKKRSTKLANQQKAATP